MRSRLAALVIFLLALPAVAAAPETFVSNCDVQFRIREGRDVEGLAIPGQSAEVILPCITKKELARIIEDFGKGDAEKKDRALGCLETGQEDQVTGHTRPRDAGKRLSVLRTIDNPDYTLPEALPSKCNASSRSHWPTLAGSGERRYFGVEA